MAVTTPGARAGQHGATPIPVAYAPAPPTGCPKPSVRRSAARIALVYLGFALLWILLSDRVVDVLASDQSVLTRVQSLKGSAFVAGSAGLIYVLLRRELRKRERAAEELEQAEARYRTLVEQIPAITYVNAVDESTRTLYVSPQAEALLGFTRREWLEDPELWISMLHPDDRERALAGWLRCRDRGEPFDHEYRMVARDGRVVWFQDHALVLHHAEGRPGLIHGVMFDVTEPKRVEDELRRSQDELRESVAGLRRADAQRRSLLGRLVDAEDRERRRIASDVHDGPIQKLTAMVLRLEALRTRVDGPERTALEKLLRSAQTSTASLRHLVFELRPPALDREGLVAALREHLERVEAEGGPDYRIVDRMDRRPSREVAAIAYRIACEALANARKHGRATRVSVALEPWDGGMKARIEDDGVGFDPRVAPDPAAGHFGLSDMRERAEMAGGWLRVDAAAGAGTAVEFWLPLAGTVDAAGDPAISRDGNTDPRR